jgi:ABC-type ATPase involved in cell division
MSYLRIENISKQYDEKNIALSDVAFSLQRGAGVTAFHCGVTSHGCIKGGHARRR